MSKQVMAGIEYAKDACAVAEGADGLVLVTEWSAFRGLDLNRMRSAMLGNTFVDLRNVYRQKEAEAAGFSYTSIGRPVGADQLSSTLAAE